MNFMLFVIFIINLHLPPFTVKAKPLRGLSCHFTWSLSHYFLGSSTVRIITWDYIKSFPKIGFFFLELTVKETTCPMRIGYNDALQKIHRSVNHVSLNYQKLLWHFELSISRYLRVKKKGILSASVLKRGDKCDYKKAPKEPVFLVCCSFLQPQNALCSWQFNFCPTANSSFYSYAPLATCSNAGHSESLLLISLRKSPRIQHNIFA